MNNVNITGLEVTPLGGVGGDVLLKSQTNLTGSCFLLTFKYTKGYDKNIIIDFGLHQGLDYSSEFNHELPFDVKSITAAIVTHAHIDHCGRIPFLYNSGFEGATYFSSQESMELSFIQLEDCAKLNLQEYDAKVHNFNKYRRACAEAGNIKKQRENAKSPRNGNRCNKPSVEELKKAEEKKQSILSMLDVENIDAAAPIPPIYRQEDVEKARNYSSILPKTIKDLPGVSFEVYSSGHILGAKSIVVSIKLENGKTKRVVFSADLGNYDREFSPHGNPVTDPKMLIHAMFCETTYGGTLRDKNYYIDGLAQFVKDVERELSKGKTVIIPSFAMDRGQELLYHLKGIKNTKIYYDTKSGNLILPVYQQYNTIYKNAELKYIPINCENRTEVYTNTSAKIIVTSSGMCNGGPVREYLDHYLEDENAVFMLTGHMSPNTIGGKLYHGSKVIYLKGEPKVVKAKIITYDFFSAHADERSLLRWIEGWKTNTKTQIVLNHGEIEGSTLAFKHTIERKQKKGTTSIQGTPVIAMLNRSIKI